MTKRAKGPVYWLRVLERYEAVRATMTMREFAAGEGIAYWTFHDWLYGLRRAAQKVTPSRAMTRCADGPVRMLPVHVEDGLAAGDDPAMLFEKQTAERGLVAPRPVEAELPGGVTLRFGEGTAPEYLADVAGALVRGMRC